MKKIFPLLLIMFAFSSLALTKQEALDSLIQKYPDMQLADVYKSFYQDNFGPGHLLADSIGARNYFMEELADTLEWKGPEYEFTGEGKNFVRVNMDLVRKGIIPSDMYFQSFLNSINRIQPLSDEEWITEWGNLDSLIRDRNYVFFDEQNDRELIKRKIESRNFPVHHSDRFNKIYNFHYRIISIPEFENLKAKYLKP